MRSAAAATLAIAVLTAAVYAAKPAQPATPPAQPAESNSSTSIYAPLGKARSLFYSGKPEESLALLEDLANSDKFQIRLEARFLAGRCLWLSDNEKDQKQAQKIWDQFAKDIADWKPGPVRIAIAKALVLEEAGDETQAIRTLEAAVARNVRNVCTPEAQIELAKLLARAGRVEEAKQQLASAEDLLNRETKVEMYKDEAAPYYAAIKVTRDGLKYDANPGLAEVEQADKLRADKKFAEAGKLYEQILSQWPKSESADRATVGMGHCLLAIGKSAPAADLWRKFIAAAPAARWRGQATTGLLDMGLEGQLTWEETRKLAAWAESTLPTALADDKAKPSWQAAAYGLHLQLAAIHWISGQYEPAGAALDQCIKLSEGDRAKRLSSLAEVVRAKKSLLPDGVMQVAQTGQMDPASVVLSMSVIEALAEQYESSEHFATLVATGRLAGTPNQRAFATFLQICLDDTVGRVAPAASSSGFSNPQIANPKSLPLSIDQRYLQLTKSCPDAPWLDEVIYRMAARKDAKAKEATTTDPSGRDRIMAGGDAPPLFTDSDDRTVVQLYRWLVESCPGSVRAERSSWRLGRLLTESGDVDAANEINFRLLQRFPKGPYVGDAMVRIVDVALEREFDFSKAQKLAEQATTWAGAAAATQPTADAVSLEPWRMIGGIPAVPVGDFIKYEIYLRAGLLAYMNGEPDRAAAWFQAAKPQGPDSSGRVTDTSVRNIGLMVMANSAQRKLISWDEKALACTKTPQQRTAIQLADCFLHAGRTDKAVSIYTRFMDKDPLLKPLTPELEGYCTWRLALSYAEGRSNQEKAVALYRRYYDAPLKNTPWAPDAILRLGVLTYNRTQDPRQAMTHYEYFLKHFPGHPETERVLYFYSLCAIQSGNRELSVRCVEEYAKKFADSPNRSWLEHARRELAKLQATPSPKERKD